MPAQGPPARAGRARPTRHGGLYVLVALIAVLNLVGLVMVLSASAVLSLRQFGSPWHYFLRQATWVTLGTVAFLVAKRIDYRFWRHFAKAGMVLAVLLLLAVLVPGIGVRAGGASRWIGTSFIRVQPSEFAKLALILFAADVLDRRGESRGWRYQMGPVLCAVVILAALVLEQPDMGTAMVMCFIVVAMVFAAGMPWRPLGVMLGVGVVGSFLMAVVAPYRWRRLTAFINPFAKASNSGYQSVQGILALANGHLAGQGLGSSIAAWGYLPNAETDFIFAVIGEETGLIGTVCIAGLFLAFGLVGVRIACRAKDRFGALLVAGITAWLVGQAVINIGAVVGLLPVTGVPLPFVSYGGSSLAIAMVGTGIMANVASQS